MTLGADRINSGSLGPCGHAKRRLHGGLGATMPRVTFRRSPTLPVTGQSSGPPMYWLPLPPCLPIPGEAHGQRSGMPGACKSPL
jgi:hypothetical protein